MTLLAWPEVVPATAVGENVLGPTTSKTVLGADPQLRVNEGALKKTIARLTEETHAPDTVRNWSVALRLLLAWLPGLRFEEAAVVVGIPPANLARILHGELRLQPSKHDRIRRMLNLALAIRSLLDDVDIAPWYRAEVPALRGISPLEAARRGRIEQLERLVSSYFDTRFA
jgi:hypothetical protein